MKTTSLNIDGVEYTVQELTMRVVMPLMKEVDSSDLSIELAKKAVSVNGEPLGDDLLDLSFSTYSQLAAAVNDVHGFVGDEGAEEKND